MGEFKLAGFALACAQAGEQIPIQTSIAMTSDHPFFHRWVRDIANNVDGLLRAQGAKTFLEHANSFAIVVEPDSSATLYFNDLDIELEIVTKRTAQKSEAVFSNDIGDIYSGRLPNLRLKPHHRYIVCLRQGWKFLFIMDLHPERPDDLDFFERMIGSSLKTLMTEIEGVLRDHHVPRTPGRQKMDKILDVAFEQVLAFAGKDTMYFPVQFVDYLKASIFPNFDPDQPSAVATRHTTAHGHASVEAYTAVRALQTILVLDQIQRYLTLPTKPPRGRRRSSS